MDLEVLKSPALWIALGLLALLWGLGTLFERTHQANLRDTEARKRRGADREGTTTVESD